MKPKGIKLFWLMSLVVLLVAAMAVAAGRLWPRLFPPDYTSGLYHSYSGRHGIDATCLRGFPLNDSVCVDVIILQATDSAGWETLKEDFGIKDYPQEALPYIDTNTLDFRYAPKNGHSQPKDSVLLANDYLVVSQYRKNVTVFDIKNEEQVNAIISYKLKRQNPNYYE